MWAEGGQEFYDPMNNADRIQINCLDHGFAALVDIMPRRVRNGQTVDHAIEEAARVSYQNETRAINTTRGLIRYLMRHTHTTPFEMVEFKFHCSMPITIARQWIRHRTANVNEVSGRYSVMPNKFFTPHPNDIRAQSNKSKQVSEGQCDALTAEEFANYVDRLSIETYGKYEEFIARGVGREQARIVLPPNLYTEWYWKIDLHNLFHFLALRMHSHAQKEIQVYAKGMFQMVKQMCPIAAEAFEDYHHMVGGMKLSRLEIEAIARGDLVASDNAREQAEFIEKMKRLGLCRDGKPLAA
jgi:thymidylate synthase (FAD)